MSIKLPTISWEAIISNTSVVSGENYRYTCTLSPVNINDPGYGQLEVGYYIVDYIGHIFKIEEVTGYDIKVHDLLEDTQFSGPYNDQNGYVYSSLKEAALVAQAKLNRLDKSAEDFVRSLGLDSETSTEYLVVNTFQTAHGFTNDFIYHNGLNWVKAQANSGETCATHYAIRIDDDNFKLIPVGELDLGSLTDENGDPLVVGEYYFLSQTNAGKITGTKPTDGIIQSVLKSNSTSRITVSIQEPYDINDVGGGSGVSNFIELNDVQSPYVADKFLKVNGTADGIIYVDEPESMVYPDAGIPISTGSAWSTSIVDNSSNWNDAYDHSILVTGNPHAVSFSQLGGSPSDVITAGTNLSWDGNTLNASGGSSITFGNENEIPTVNSTTDGFDYSQQLSWNGTVLTMYNTAFGNDYNNVVIGRGAVGGSLTSAYSNVIIGDNIAPNFRSGDQNVLLGKQVASIATDINFTVAIGTESAQAVLTQEHNIFLGAYSGKYETQSNKLFIDSLDRTDEATARTSSLIYGEFNSTVSSQWLRINGQFQLKDGLTAPSTVSGYAQIYVDSADGDLKIKFGDGTVKTIVTDS